MVREYEVMNEFGSTVLLNAGLQQNILYSLDKDMIQEVKSTALVLMILPLQDGQQIECASLNP